MQTIQTVAPATPIVTLEEAKLFAIIDIDDDDTIIQTMIDTASNYVEQYTNRQMINATFELINDSFIQDMVIPKGKIQSIVSVEYMDENEVYQTLPTTEYYLYGEYDRYKIHFNDIPSHKEDMRAVKITFIAGYGTVDDVPAGIKSYIKIKVKDLYEYRDLIEDFNKFVMPKSHIDCLLNMYRIQPI